MNNQKTFDLVKSQCRNPRSGIAVKEGRSTNFADDGDSYDYYIHADSIIGTGKSYEQAYADWSRQHTQVTKERIEALREELQELQALEDAV